MHNDEISDILDKALIEEKNGNNIECLKLLTIALNKNTQLDNWVYLKIGRLLLNNNRVSEVQDLVKRIGKISSCKLAQQLVYCQLLDFQKNWAECQEAWELCIEQFPHELKPFWYNSLIKCLQNQSKFTAALEICDLSIKSFPSYVPTFIQRAKIASKIGLIPEAIDYWNLCFSKFPDRIDASWYENRSKVYTLCEDHYNARLDKYRALYIPERKKYYDHLFDKLINPQNSNLNFEHIVIVTYGRSGSTLLQGILNSIPGVVLRGENDNVFYDLYKLYRKLSDVKKNHLRAITPNLPWFGAPFIQEKKIFEKLRELSSLILYREEIKEPIKTTFGFKEIRYYEVEDDLLGYLEFLNELLPNLGIIYLTRDLDKVLKSAFWVEEESTIAKRKLEIFEGRMSDYIYDRANCFHIKYEEVIGNLTCVKSLFDFLGARTDTLLLEDLMKIKHSY